MVPNSRISVPGQYEDESCVIYVGNIDSRIPDEKIVEFFSQYGNVISIFRRLLDSFYPKVRTKTFKPPRNGVQYAFIRFETSDSVQKVMKDAKGMILGRRKITVKARVLNPAKVEGKAENSRISPSMKLVENNGEPLNQKPLIGVNGPTVVTSNAEALGNVASKTTSAVVSPLPQPSASEQAQGTATTPTSLNDFNIRAIPPAFTSSLTLNVLNLPTDTTPIELYQYFKEAGTVKGTAISQFRDYRGYRCGEVIMESVEDCNEAIRRFNGCAFRGSILEVGMKTPFNGACSPAFYPHMDESAWNFPYCNSLDYGTYHPAYQSSSMNSMSWAMGSPTKDASQWPDSVPMDPCNLYVKNLDDAIISSKGQLEALFSPYGTIISSMLAVYANTGISKGYGFVAFRRPEEAYAARESLNGAMIGKKRIFVCFAERKEERVRRLQAMYGDVQGKALSLQTGEAKTPSLFVKPTKKVIVTIKPPKTETESELKKQGNSITSTKNLENQTKTSKAGTITAVDDAFVGCSKGKLQAEASALTEITTDVASINSTNKALSTETPKPLESVKPKERDTQSTNSQSKLNSASANLKKIRDVLQNRLVRTSYFLPRAQTTTCTTFTHVTVEPVHYRDGESVGEEQSIASPVFMKETTANVYVHSRAPLKNTEADKENRLTKTNVTELETPVRSTPSPQLNK
ncbi:poly(A) binding protein Crp79 [Schizosaccharomyces japonicus yFS275]|uniref:Poly(A) binding protein Crp79 n=1 Tax=Schizosaccharomyces japonicus (strain yFS275 / FY16936) TaxID=402676 RepID=B6K3U2_SCHJY|nr:poly(A) binding protein Crp79 [Schizosaccharomyces japonicus yFS275]EEB08149.2 poly(A) binding protein Crp79 [Schizosaccharomyces japonicus yFS275]